MTVIRAYLELLQGKPETFTRLVKSEAIQELYSSHVILTNADKLVAASRGDAALESCRDEICLIAARNPTLKPIALKQLNEMVSQLGATLEPLERLYDIGSARILARALGESATLAQLDRMLSETRKVTLNPKLAVVQNWMTYGMLR